MRKFLKLTRKSQKKKLPRSKNPQNNLKKLKSKLHQLNQNLNPMKSLYKKHQKKKKPHQQFKIPLQM